MKYQRRWYVWAFLRITLGLIFLWSFFDKVFGLGLATARESAWIAGNSPTAGFLGFATRGPFAPFFQSLAGQAWVDWTFMLALLIIGVTLTIGIMVRIGSIIGAVLMFLIWLSALPPQNNPFLDSHIIYIIVFIGLIIVHAGRYIGCGTWWCHRDLVKKYKWLE